MTPIFPELPHPLGVYSLTRLLELREYTELYEARQTHVDRAVVLEVLRPGVPHAAEVAFLAQARHRVATAGVPHVAAVFESLRAEGLWFLTQERPQGSSLADLAAKGGELSVPDICRVISAAGRMYETYAQGGHHAMPMASSSIYVEAGGEVHFLSPLMEGGSNEPQQQMEALATALWAVCPQEKEPGLGRTITLLQWLQEGMNGTFLSWTEAAQTADTIIEQLETNAQPESEKTAITRMRERISRNPGIQRLRTFMSQWGGHLAASVASIAVLSSIGTQLGMKAPEISAACDDFAMHCQQDGVYEQVLLAPVSVQQYAEFIQAFYTLPEARQQELLQEMTDWELALEPADWETQLNREKPQEPITGVSYWQALLYARHAGGNLPTAAQLQMLRATNAPAVELEWSRSAEETPLPGIYNGTAYLLIDKQGKVRPTGSRTWQDARCGFRITLPEEQK